MNDLNVIKIRDQGMDLRFFVVCFKICTRGLAFKLRVGFLCFLILTLFGKSFKLAFLGRTLDRFRDLNFRVKGFELKYFSKSQKVIKSTIK